MLKKLARLFRISVVDPQRNYLFPDPILVPGPIPVPNPDTDPDRIYQFENIFTNSCLYDVGSSIVVLKVAIPLFVLCTGDQHYIPYKLLLIS